MITLDLQIGESGLFSPERSIIEDWLNSIATELTLDDTEVTIRIASESESQSLNKEYRGKDKPTNVLSFPFEAPAGLNIPLLGDLVICSDVVQHEAIQQNKRLLDHWAHMVIHGCLHLLGFDHINDDDATEMEALEVTILKRLAIDDPYQDDYS